MSDCVLCKIKGSVATVIINRPQALNALNAEVLEKLHAVMKGLDGDSTIKAVILTGAGEKAFVAGADIAAMRDMSTAEAKAWASLGQRTMNRVAAMRPVTIAAVNGYALGGGCELAMACDLRVASTKAKLGIPEVSLGVIPGFGGTQRLPRLIGLGRALEVLSTGRQVGAAEAEAWGLVNRVTGPKELLPFCMELAEKITANSTVAVSLGKQAMDSGMEMDLARGLELEAALFGVAFAAPDQKEGMTAFLEKRKANFTS